MRKTLVALLLTLPACALAEKHELGLTLGGLTSQDIGGGPRLSGGTALQANYGYRLLGGKVAALYGEVHFLANAQRLVESAGPLATTDVATIFLTPGVRLKFLPNAPVAPYFAIGGGLATFEQSRLRADGGPNDAPRTINRGAIDFGAGVDVKLWRWLGLRGEIRDFYTGAPAYNLSGFRGGQHNPVAGGGFVIRWGGE